MIIGKSELRMAYSSAWYTELELLSIYDPCRSDSDGGKIMNAAPVPSLVFEPYVYMLIEFVSLRGYTLEDVRSTGENDLS